MPLSPAAYNYTTSLATIHIHVGHILHMAYFCTYTTIALSLYIGYIEITRHLTLAACTYFYFFLF